MERGNDFELHWLVPSRPTVEQMAVGVGEQRRVFEQAFDGMAPVGGRAHSLYWAGYTETAAILAANGLRIETDFMTPRGCQHGYCGSARPARFIAPSGDLLAVRQQPTVLMDDAMSNDKLLLPACSAEDAYGIAAQLYDETAERFHGVICACLHPSLSPGFRYKLPVQDALRSAAIDSTRRHGLKAMTYRAWSAFLEARGLVDLRFEAGRWVARAGAAIQDATFHAPAAEGVRRQGLSWQSVTRSLAQGETFALG
jgi:hypothetical protein